jgi:hypothetical protein
MRDFYSLFRSCWPDILRELDTQLPELKGSSPPAEEFEAAPSFTADDSDGFAAALEYTRLQEQLWRAHAGFKTGVPCCLF